MARRDVLPGINAGVSEGNAPHLAHSYGPRSQVSPQPHAVSYDRYSLLVDGRRVVLFGGEYQFWRTPAPERWPVVLAEMRAAGLNEVTVGVSWQYHSPAPGVYDFSGIRDLGRFLDDAARAGLYVIARPGPVYDAESNASNIPGWLLARGINLRANDGHAYCGAGAQSPAYAAAYTDWFRHVLPIMVSRQLTTGGGTVIALQIENEYLPRCGDPQYMTELHDLARELGIDVPLLANNNTCCTPAGAWHGTADDGQPIVDMPAEDDYPCAGPCPKVWDSSLFRTVDGLEARLRGAGVTAAPIAVAELQSGYYTGWGGPSYARLSAEFGPAFTEVLDGSVLGQGATLVSLYMVAGGTSWGYMAGPNTATSYDYAAPIHEWGAPNDSYAALKRTGMFVQSFGDALAATQRLRVGQGPSAVWASNPSLLYAARLTVDGPQRGAQLIVLRNTDPHWWSATRLRVRVDGHDEAVPRSPGAIRMPPHALYLLLAGYNLGPFRLRYATSRPLTQARIGGAEVAVFYGVPGTAGEIALAFAHRPAVLRVDPDIAVHYDPQAGELRLDYRHEERLRSVVLQAGGHRLVLLLTGPQGAARTWLIDTPGGDPTLVTGPRLVTAVAQAGAAPRVQATLRGDTSVALWAPSGARGIAITGVAVPAPGPHVLARRADAAYLRRSPDLRYDRTLQAATMRLDVHLPTLSLPTLGAWRFMVESPETVPAFDDAAWTPADEAATTNPNVPPSDTLLADDYGFHYGFVWYRGTFTGTGNERGLRLLARNSYSVWLNGLYLGSSTTQNDLKNVDDQVGVDGSQARNETYADPLLFRIAPGQIKVGAANTIAVLVESLGHNIGFANGQRARSPMGILSAQLVGPESAAGGVAPAISWKVQGGPEYGPGADWPLNASGLFGERNGWYRPSFDDHLWPSVMVPDDWAARGLQFQGVGWYRTTFDLNLPPNVSAPLGLLIPHAQDKVAIWLNGLLIGRYWEGVGPQHLFYLPAGLLNEHGRNTLALAVWNRGHHGGLVGGVSLQPYDVNAQITLQLGRG